MKSKKINVRKICITAMLTAIALVLDRLLFIEITPSVKITFAFIPVALAAIVYGPVSAAAVYGVADLLGAIIRPMGGGGLPHPGLTLSFAAMGLVYGFSLCLTPLNVSHKSSRGGFAFKIYRNAVRFFPNIVFAALINSVIFDLIINTAWLSALFDTSYWGLFVPRLLKCAIMIPAQLLIIPVLLKVSVPIRKIAGVPSVNEETAE